MRSQPLHNALHITKGCGARYTFAATIMTKYGQLADVIDAKKLEEDIPTNMNKYSDARQMRKHTSEAKQIQIDDSCMHGE
jgi:hypothetical protein